MAEMEAGEKPEPVDTKHTTGNESEEDEDKKAATVINSANQTKLETAIRLENDLAQMEAGEKPEDEDKKKAIID